MSLYSTGFFIRRSVFLFFIFIGVLISFGLIGTITQKLISNLPTVTPEQASELFGKITPPAIKSASVSDNFKPINFAIDTLTGTLPDYTSSFKISASEQAQLINLYQVDYPVLDAAAKVEGYDLKDALQFSGDPQNTKDITYVWSDTNRIYTYNSDTRTFNLVSNNISSLDAASAQLGTLDNAGSYFQNLLNTIKVSTSDPLSGYKNNYVKYNGSSWDISGSPTNFIMSSYYRYSRSRGNEPIPSSLITLDGTKDPKIVPEYYPSYDYSPMYMVIKNTSNPKPTDIVEINFNKYNYSITRPQTYKPKNMNEALNDIKTGKGSLIVARNKDLTPVDTNVLKTIKNVQIKDVQLGYYVTGTRPSYILPIYVFICEFVISTNGTTQTKGDAIYYDYAFNN